MNSFIINNEIIYNQTLVDLINSRKDNQSLVPVYCRSKDKLFTIPQIKNIGLDYSLGGFKVCFGGMVTRFGKNPFRMEFLQYLFDSSYETFELYDDNLHATMIYLLLETGEMDSTFIPNEFEDIVKYVNSTYQMIDKYCREQYNILWNQQLNEE